MCVSAHTHACARMCVCASVFNYVYVWSSPDPFRQVDAGFPMALTVWGGCGQVARLEEEVALKNKALAVLEEKLSSQDDYQEIKRELG